MPTSSDLRGNSFSHTPSQPPSFPANDVPTPFSVSTLIAQINLAGGIARQNKYMVLIPTMSLKAQSTTIFNAIQASSGGSNDWMGSGYYADDVTAEMVPLIAFCHKTQLPGYQFQMETTRHYGPAFKIPHLPEYQDITMSFICGAEMNERYFFDAWMYLIMDPITNNFNYINEYCVDLVILQFDEADDGTASQPTYHTTLIDAFPVAINAQELGYDLNNTAQKLDVTFTYKFAIPFTGKGSTSSYGRGTSQRFDNTITLTSTPKTPQ